MCIQAMQDRSKRHREVAAWITHVVNNGSTGAHLWATQCTMLAMKGAWGTGQAVI